MSEQKPAIAISQAALHAALVELRERGLDHADDTLPADFLIDGLNVLIALLDPRHGVAAGSAPDQAGAPAPPAINLPDDPGSACAAGAATSSAEGAPNEPAPSAPPPAQAAEERPTPASAPPRPFGGAPITRWSEERLALLRERFPTCTDDAALLAELNALPGVPISSVKAIGARAHLMKVNRDPEIIRALRAKGAAEAHAKQQAHRSSLHERKWTPERLAILRQEFPPCLDRTALLARINALPGDPIAGVESMRAKAVTLGLRATPDTERQLRSLSGKKGGRKPRAPAPERSAAAAPPMPPSLPPTPPPAPAPIVAAPELPPEREAEIADAALAQRHQRARDMLAKSLSEKGRKDEFALASIVAAHTKLPLREVMRLMGEVRRSLEEARTARQPSAPTTVAMLHSSPPRRAIARSDDE